MLNQLQRFSQTYVSYYDGSKFKNRHLAGPPSIKITNNVHCLNCYQMESGKVSPWSRVVELPHVKRLHQSAKKAMDQKLHQLQMFACEPLSKHARKVATEVQQICRYDITNGQNSNMHKLTLEISNVVDQLPIHKKYEAAE